MRKRCRRGPGSSTESAVRAACSAVAVVSRTLSDGCLALPGLRSLASAFAASCRPVLLLLLPHTLSLSARVRLVMWKTGLTLPVIAALLFVLVAGAESKGKGELGCWLLLAVSNRCVVAQWSHSPCLLQSLLSRLYVSNSLAPVWWLLCLLRLACSRLRLASCI